MAPAACEANSCDASTPPINGDTGDCTAALASGATCQATCTTDGYTISGTTITKTVYRRQRNTGINLFQ
jgi:hypothetical protein